jgi:hypothetical protein
MTSKQLTSQLYTLKGASGLTVLYIEDLGTDSERESMIGIGKEM